MRKHHFLRMLAVLLTILFGLGMVTPAVSAATSELCELKLVSSDDGIYIYKLNDTSILFRSTVKDGGTSSKPVKLTVPSECKVLLDGKRLTGTESGANLVYTISDAGGYTAKIKGPTEDSVSPYANFKFTIWSSADTTNKTASSSAAAKADSAASASAAASEVVGAVSGAVSDLLSTEQGSYIAGDGHLVVPVTLTETFFSDFKTYEQQFRDRYFYTNVSNGKITNEQVYLDMPSGIGVLMYKDGITAEFQNRTYITQYGSYQLTMNYYDKGIKDYPAVEYVATFRFRIQKPLEPLTIGETPDSAADGASSVPNSMSDLKPDLTESELAELAGGTTDAGNLDAANLSEADMDSYVKKLIGSGDAKDTVKMEKTGVYTGLMQAYDADKGLYRQTMADAKEFYSNIPNGALTQNDVVLNFPSEMQPTVLKNDEAYQFAPGDVISQEGVYYVTPSQGSPAIFTFRILKNPVHDLNICYAPAEFSIQSATLGEKTIPAQGDYLKLQQDGDYELTFSGEGQQIQFVFTRDTVPPEFTLSGVENGIARGGAVSVEYQSDDADRIEVLKNGKQVDYAGKISDAGTYAVRVFDKAGNMASQTFELKYRMNMAGVLAILFLLLLAIAGVLVFMRFKRDTKVR